MLVVASIIPMRGWIIVWQMDAAARSDPIRCSI
jgi:hypothetical protein